MYHKMVLVMLTFITMKDLSVHCLTFYGKLANFSAVLQRIIDVGTGKLPNVMPDLTLGRKSFDNSIVIVGIKNTDNETIEYTLNEDSYNPKKQPSTYRRKRIKGYEKYQADLLRSQQEKKVNEIMKFMQDHYLTTNYLYDEVKRIKRQRKVKDDLRKMVEYLEQPDKSKMKENVLKCFIKERKSETFAADEWNHQTNNLVINVMKDPVNDGFIN